MKDLKEEVIFKHQKSNERKSFCVEIVVFSSGYVEYGPPKFVALRLTYFDGVSNKAVSIMKEINLLKVNDWVLPTRSIYTMLFRLIVSKKVDRLAIGEIEFDENVLTEIMEYLLHKAERLFQSVDQFIEEDN